VSKRPQTSPGSPKLSRSPAPRSSLLSYAVILCATILAYLPALNGTLLWDDSSHVTRLDLRSLHGLWRIWFVPGATQQYYPLLHSAFWFEHAIWGDAVLGYHLLNVLLHALAACLVVTIVRRLALPGAWLAGLCFALHPICVEAVAWISEQKSTLSGVLYLAAALVYLRFDESRRRSHYIAALGLFLLALAAKTVTATLPAALLVVLWWCRGRIESRRDILPLVPWFAVGAAAGLFTAWMERTYIGAAGAAFTLTPIDRILLASRIIWFYAAKVIWPADLTFFYERWHIDPGEWWQYLFLAGLIAAAAALWRLRRQARGPLAAFLIFAGTLFPVWGFFNVYPFRYSYVADHFAYLASLALIAPVSAFLTSLAKRRQWLLILLPATLGILTCRQAADYRDEETLYRATLDRNPNAWLAHNNLGNVLLAEPGRRDEAIAHFQTAISLMPDFWEAHLSLGNALLETPGRLDDALAEYRTAARLSPRSERVHTNLGNALLEKGDPAGAAAELAEALRMDPNNAEAHNDIGNLYSQTGRLPEAIAEYRAALRANPDFAEAHNNLGRALAQLGQMPEAIAEFQAAIRVRPGYANAHSNLGNALSALPGRLPEAIAEYQTALEIRPDSAPLHNNLGYAFSQLPDRQSDAVSEYRKALQLDPNFADAHYNLANALLRIPGRQAEALAEFETTLRLHPSARLREIVDHLRTTRK